MVSKVSKVTITYINNIITIWLTDLHTLSKNTTNSGLARKYRCCLGITSGKYRYVLSSQLPVDMQLNTVLYIDYVINILCCCLCVDYKTQSMMKCKNIHFLCVKTLCISNIKTLISRDLKKSFRDKSNETWSIIKVLLFTLFQCYFIS